MNNTPIKSIIEALLFVNEKPLLVDQIRNLFEEMNSNEIRSILLELQNEFETNKRGIRIAEVAGGFQMITSPEYAPFIKKFYSKRQAQKLSTPALETLAIIAYKQPVSRLEIESLRGVNVDGVISSLLDRNLIRITGRRECLGRPFVYGTTKEFLEYFGLKSLEDLPKIEDFSKIVPKDNIEEFPTDLEENPQIPKKENVDVDNQQPQQAPQKD